MPQNAERHCNIFKDKNREKIPKTHVADFQVSKYSTSIVKLIVISFNCVFIIILIYIYIYSIIWSS